MVERDAAWPARETRVMRWLADELRYQRSMRTARKAYRRAADRGGWRWSRDAIYQDVRGF